MILAIAAATAYSLPSFAAGAALWESTTNITRKKVARRGAIS